jgi:threonine synthase
MEYRLSCTKCGTSQKNQAAFRCSKCRAVLEAEYDYSTLKLERGFRGAGIRNSKYISFLPLDRLTCGLGEGGTQLMRSTISSFDDVNLLLKIETTNPTKTFKDRGSAVEITKAKELGFKDVCCASTGNMGLSVAHYARKAGINATIFISSNANAIKIKRIKNEGAKLAEIKGDFNKALNAAEAFAIKNNVFVCGDYHFRKEGQKTLVFEIIDQMRYSVPDVIFTPVGNATLLAAIHKGLREYKKAGLIKRMPRIAAVQSEKCDPLVRAFNNKKEIKYTRPETEADAIAVGYPTFGFEGIRALKETKGMAIAVSEQEIEDAVRFLERKRIYAELGGGTAFAGFIKTYYGNKHLVKGKKVVVIITGNNEGVFKEA